VAVVQTGTKLALQLRAPTVQVADDRMTTGIVDGQRVSLYFSNPQDDFGADVSINLLDKLNATDTFSFTGELVFQGNDPPISTGIKATFRYWSRPVTQPPSWECRATDYPVTLRR
jgi:hypothetical protein